MNREKIFIPNMKKQYLNNFQILSLNLNCRVAELLNE